MKKIGKIILSTVAPATILTTASLSGCACSEQRQEIIHESVYFKTPSIAKKIIVVDLTCCWGYQDEMNTLFQSLEGILAQEEAQLFVCSGDTNRDKWFYDMKDKFGFETEFIGDWEGIWALLGKYKLAFNGQYVKYTKATAANNNISINNAAMIAACDHYLMVSDTLLANADYKAELDKLRITEETNVLSSWPTLSILTRYKSKLNPKMLLHQSPIDFALRDYAIAAKIPVVCVGLEQSLGPWISSFLVDGAPMLGWSCGFENEQEYVHWASSNNIVVLAADHAANLSLFSYDKPEFAYKQTKKPKIKANKNKHYVAIVMSDGDNIQWMQNDFLRSRDYWGSKYRGKFPISWTISPSAIDLNPGILDEMYAEATDNDDIIAGPSGFGYINPAYYEGVESLNKFANITADYMHDCDLTCINTLDFLGKHEETVPDYHCMTPYLLQDQVKGLVWAVTDLSLSGHGSVDWINNKPILSFREGFWDKKCLRIDEVANRINNYPRDPSRIDGYTAITACVWNEGKMDKINEFVKLLKDDVELVTIDQMLDLITENVKHESAIPEQYAPWGD